MQTRMPVRNTAGDKITRALAEHGPMTMEQGICMHGKIGPWLSTAKTAYKNAMRAGWIDRKGDTYHLMPHVQNHIDQCKPHQKVESTDELVKPAAPPKFVPWTGKADFTAGINAHRIERDRGYRVSGTQFCERS